MKLPILVPLYNPSTASLERLANLQEQTNLYLYDNSPDSHDSYFSCASYHSNQINGGISAAIKWMLTQNDVRTYGAFLFFDQDTLFQYETISFIESQIQQLPTQAVLANFSGSYPSKVNARFVINSGTVFRADSFPVLGEVAGAYFVDAIDLAVCIGIRARGQTIARIHTELIDHTSDQGYQKATLLGMNITFKPYPSSRRREFFRGHGRLITQCVRDGHFREVIYLLKCTGMFCVGQLKADLLKGLGRTVICF